MKKRFTFFVLISFFILVSISIGHAQVDTLWTKTFGGSNLETGYSVRQTTDGGYIITGYTGSFGAGGWDVWLVKTNAFGDTLWTKTYGGGLRDIGLSVQQTTDEGYIITGNTESFDASGRDIWLIKTTLDVNKIEQNNDIITSDFSLQQNYPNPFNPITTIKFSLPKTSEVTLKIYNILGKEVTTLVSKQLHAGSYTYEWDASGMPSGVYLYRLEVSEYIALKKMIPLK